MAIRSLSLCAGIGGIDLGLSAAIPGYRTVCYVEVEAFCASILAARMDNGLDDAPIWDDIATFDATAWRGSVDLVCGGYPCQPFSVAGRRKGEQDARHLWPHFVRIIRQCGPAYVFLENVQGHVSMGLRRVCADLRHLGYDISAGIFSAAQCGAPHMRKRLFMLATYSDSKRCGERRAKSAIHKRRDRSNRCNNKMADANHAKRRPDNTLKFDMENGRHGLPLGREQGHRQLGTGCAADGSKTKKPQAKRRMDNSAYGLPLWMDGWEQGVPRTTTSQVERIAKLKALGNAVVPATAALAWRTLYAQSQLGGRLGPYAPQPHLK